MIAQFDTSSGAAYAEQDVPASSAHKVTVVAVIPATTKAALLGGGSTDSNALILLFGDGGSQDSIFASHDFGSWQWWTAQAAGDAAGDAEGDGARELVAEATFDTGTTWTIVWKVDGSTLFTNSVDLGLTDLDPFPVRVGGDGAANPGSLYVESVEIRDAADAVVFADDFSSGDFSAWDSVVGEASVVSAIPGPPVPPASLPYQSPAWRFVVGDLITFETLSFLDRIATERAVNYVLNAPAQAVGKVPSHNPEVNIPWPDTDSDPFLTEGSRVLWGFRHEGAGGSSESVVISGSPTEGEELTAGIDDVESPRWVIRFAGIIMQLNDVAASDDASSAYTAYDPWQYLFSRPVCNADGTLPGKNGLSFTGRVGVIAATLLKNTIDNHGIVGIDAGLSYGGTGLYGGTIAADTEIDINFAQGTSLGEAWQTLCNSDYCDIVLTPIYDPINRPGYLVEFNIYNQVGSAKDDEIFAWDMPSRSLVGLDRLYDGTQRANKVKYFAGQGGSAPGGQTVAIQEDAASAAKFGEYWRQQFFPSQTILTVVQALAAAQVELMKSGKVTVTFSPAPERSPHPFTGYFLGDRVPVYASNRFRAPIPDPSLPTGDGANYQRIYGIPLTIGDDATEQVQQMLTAIPSGA